MNTTARKILKTKIGRTIICALIESGLLWTAMVGRKEDWAATWEADNRALRFIRRVNRIYGVTQ